MLYPVNIPRFGSAVRWLDWEMGDGVVWGSVEIPGSFNRWNIRSSHSLSLIGNSSFILYNVSDQCCYVDCKDFMLQGKMLRRLVTS